MTRENSSIVSGGLDEDNLAVEESPSRAKIVRQMSKGYVARVAAVPATPPETNARAVGFDEMFFLQVSTNSNIGLMPGSDFCILFSMGLDKKFDAREYNENCTAPYPIQR